jgi:hypothetical protein
MARETVGKVSSELLAKAPDTRNPIEIERTLHKEYEKEVFECIERGKKAFDSDFYIVVITKKEPLMQNVLRHYFLCRLSCPTPDYDQTVYKFTRATEIIEFLWVIPSRETCFTLTENIKEVVPAEYGLLENVLKFADGTLFKLAKTLNGEVELASPLIEGKA